MRFPWTTLFDGARAVDVDADAIEDFVAITIQDGGASVIED